MMRKWTAFLVLALLTALFTPTLAEENGILGQPFPDFTVETGDGETFTLSEILKEKQAVVINLWATWCPPCKMEFPYLNEAYKARQDQAAVIALSVEGTDTLDVIRQYREEMGLAFPMGRDEGGVLGVYTNAYVIPTTVVVDRFGNAVFLHRGAVTSAAQFIRLMDAFLGDGYAQSRPLWEFPRAVEWRVSTEEEARRVRFLYDGTDLGWVGLITRDGDATLCLETDQIAENYVFFDEGVNRETPMEQLYDALQGAYLYHAKTPEGDAVALMGVEDGSGQDNTLIIWLCAGEAGADEIAAQYQNQGFNVTWEYIEE